MSKEQVYTKWDPKYIPMIIELMATIRTETHPHESHPDTGAIEDCWNSLEEMVNLLIKEVEPPEKVVSVGHFKAFGDGRYEFTLSHVLSYFSEFHVPAKWHEAIENAINKKLSQFPGQFIVRPT